MYYCGLSSLRLLYLPNYKVYAKCYYVCKIQIKPVSIHFQATSFRVLTFTSITYGIGNRFDTEFQTYRRGGIKSKMWVTSKPKYYDENSLFTTHGKIVIYIYILYFYIYHCAFIFLTSYWNKLNKNGCRHENIIILHFPQILLSYKRRQVSTPSLPFHSGLSQ